MSPRRWALTESLLVFSDVHLGSDLNDSGPKVPRSTAIDRDLAALLAHYRRTAPPADRWRLVIAGDFVDFVGMSIDPREGDVLLTEPTSRERALGLGGAEDHVRLKLERARARHPEVFAELAAFVGGGNALTFVHGNHDLEMHWDSVREAFVQLLGADRSRVDFEPWFFHLDGIVYIEHGHQYDPFCATPYVLAPLSPRDPTRVLESLSDTLLRSIVRRTPGMKEYGHEGRGLTSYISWGLTLGARGTARLFSRFFGAVLVLRDTARAYASDGGAFVRDEHERCLVERSAATGIPVDRLRAALALHVVPLGRTPRGVLASVMLDRFAVFLVMVPLLLTLTLLRSHLGAWAVPSVLGLLLAWLALHVWLSRGRPNVDPAAVMVDRASRLSELFPSSFVVMGHTHVPSSKQVGDAIYINVGSWAEEEPDPSAAKPYRAPRTHLVLAPHPDRHQADLREWISGEGPRTIRSLVRLTGSAGEGGDVSAVAS